MGVQLASRNRYPVADQTLRFYIPCFRPDGCVFRRVHGHTLHECKHNLRGAFVNDLIDNDEEVA